MDRKCPAQCLGLQQLLRNFSCHHSPFHDLLLQTSLSPHRQAAAWSQDTLATRGHPREAPGCKCGDRPKDPLSIFNSSYVIWEGRCPSRGLVLLPVKQERRGLNWSIPETSSGYKRIQYWVVKCRETHNWMRSFEKSEWTSHRYVCKHMQVHVCSWAHLCGVISACMCA